MPSSSSSSARIIPLEDSPRSFTSPSVRPSGSTAPGSATATVAPAPKFQAPQTICRGSGFADVDEAHLEPVGVRVLACLEHAPDEVLAEVPVRVRHAALTIRSTSQLVTSSRWASSSSGQVERDVLAQPADGDLQNCLRKRRSLFQSSRRSGKPCRSIAIRSIPKPNAKPGPRLGVVADGLEDGRVDDAGAAHLDPAGVPADVAALRRRRGSR